MTPLKSSTYIRFVCLVTILGLFASGCSLTKKYQEFTKTLWHKIDRLARADQINEHLDSEVARLQAENLRLKRKLQVHEEALRAQRIRSEAIAEGGSPESRTERSLVPELFEKNKKRSPASVHHDEASPQAFDDILSAPPKRVFEQSIRAFQHQEFDRAARGFVALAGNKHNTKFANSQVNFMAGVSLFQMNNYKRASEYFEQSLKLSSEAPTSRQYAPKALAWLALCHQKLGHTTDAQKYMRQLFENHPDSAEARKLH